MKPPLSELEFIAMVHRMRVLQLLRDERPGCSLAHRQRCWEAEAELDAELLRRYLPDETPTVVEGGAP